VRAVNNANSAVVCKSLQLVPVASSE